MAKKHIGIFYKISSIPEGVNALHFRDAAMDLVDEAMEEHRAGRSTEAEVRAKEVSLGFRVRDYDQAERIVQQAVAGTQYDCISDIKRFEFDARDDAADDDDFDAYLDRRAVSQNVSLKHRIKGVLALPYKFLSVGFQFFVPLFFILFTFTLFFLSLPFAFIVKLFKKK